MATPTNTTYLSWSTSELVNWIISIDSSYEHKYKNRLSTLLTKNGITGHNINDLDREDLKEYGIINLTDRKTIYAAIQKLIVNKKRRDSLQMTSNYTEQNTENILSLSDDDTTDDKLTLLSDTQRQQMTTNGYCILDDPLNNEKAVCIVQGYIRNNFNQIYMIKDLIRIIINFYNSRYNPELYVEIICINLDDENINYSTFLAPKINISLSRVLHNRMESIAIGNRIEIDSKKVNDESMHRILQYLGHHKGIKPQSISKPIRSVKMERIVSDIWDAHYINSFSKKVIFQVILAANYLDCPCLLHLGAAKIATLIKGKSPEEIRNILADDGS
eukprot:220595_1